MTYSVKDITIVITCYKEGELLRRAIASVANQTILGFSVLLINDCSPDTITNSICLELANTFPLHYIRLERNGGSAVARNMALKNCTTLLIVPLDGDDELPKNLVETVLYQFNKHPQADYLFGDYIVEVPETNQRSMVSCAELADGTGLLKGELLARNWRLLGQLPYKRHLWERIGGFKEEFSRTYEDVVFWRDAILADMQGLYVNQVLYVWHRSEQGKNASLDEHAFLPVRIHGLPFYDRFYPEYSLKMRHYIHRYFAARLMASELNDFLKLPHENTFTFWQRFKAKLMYARPIYIMLRRIANVFRFPK
jgi:glycosyltransferase involved in cell wall biosynthesis